MIHILDIGLTGNEMLHSFISKYKENGYNSVKRKQGRSIMQKVIKKKANETIEEE
jgi:transposase